MNTILTRVAKAIHATAMIRMSWDELNETEKYSYFCCAKAAVRALKGKMPTDIYDNFKCDKPWALTNSTEVWNLWLDAILKE